MRKIAKDSNGNWIGYEDDNMVQSDDMAENGYSVVLPGESTEFQSDFIFFHPTEDGWVETDHPTM